MQQKEHSLKLFLLGCFLLSLTVSVSGEACSKVMIGSKFDSVLEDWHSNVVNGLTSSQKSAAFKSTDDTNNGSQNRVQTYQCPRIFENRKKEWCCNSNTPEAHCCEWRERAKHMSWGEYQSMLIVVLLFAAAFLIMFLFCLVVAIKLHEQMPQPIRICPFSSRNSDRPQSSAPEQNQSLLPGDSPNDAPPPAYSVLFPNSSDDKEMITMEDRTPPTADGSNAITDNNTNRTSNDEQQIVLNIDKP